MDRPEDRRELKSGTKADIHEPDEVSHREFTVFYHDALDNVNADGSEPVWPGTDNPQSVHAINYHAATTSAKLADEEDADIEELADEPCNQIGEQEDQGFQEINYPPSRSSVGSRTTSASTRSTASRCMATRTRRCCGHTRTTR